MTKKALSATVIIPARYHSTRLPGKPLLDVNGHSLIYHSYRSITPSPWIRDVVVATDDQRIKDVVEGFGGRAVMTSAEPKTGTDRIAETVEQLEGEVFVNVQGDEILLNKNFLDPLIEAFSERPEIQMGTLKRELTDWNDIRNPNIVKVVSDISGHALYFSRSPIPYHRDLPASAPVPSGAYYRHFGVYIYRRPFLREYHQWPESSLESIEKLEQLRAMERGVKIWVMETKGDSLRVDTKEDLESVKNHLAGKHG
ncbi:MAG TPA: 3-deoxy-manno-octulosonate cytidylyltransferase [Nitrospiria bacterium]|nr:3-deoxy-manno-octulosonate cytidylyltransferase [Nitrospiria bacterium]